MEIKLSIDGKASFNPRNNRIASVANNQFIKGISTIIKELKQDFNKEEKANSVAIREKKSIKDVLAEWDKKKQDSITRGLRVHSYLEDKLGGVEAEISCESTKQAEKFYKDFIKSGRLIPQHQEQLVYYKDVYGGILDADFITVDNKTCIVDYKTNDTLSDIYWDTFKPPFNTVGSSKMAEYTLQLNLLVEAYRYSRGINVDYMYIIHITDEDYSFIGINDIRDTIEFKKLINGDYSRT